MPTPSADATVPSASTSAPAASGRLAEVVDTDNYVENCVGLTGWTIGLDISLTKLHPGYRDRASADLSRSAMRTWSDRRLRS